MAKTQNAVKLAPTAAPVGNVIKKNVFALKTRPAMAEAGMQDAKLVSVICEAGIEKGKKINRIVKTVEIEATDPKNHHVLTKNYNILPSGRGFSGFIADINAWSGAELTEDDMYVEHDFTEEFGGKPLVVEVGHRKIGKNWESYIVAFHPAGAVDSEAVGA